MKSIKTTAFGIVTILAALSLAAKALLDADSATMPDWGAIATAIAAGIGLIMAKDFNITGGTKPQ